MTSSLFAPTGTPLSPELAYARALASDRARARMTDPGHRLYWMSDTSFSCIELSVGRDHHAVIGTHEACDIRLRDDPGVENRHVLVRSRALDDGCAVLDVLDLDTRTGFALTDGSRPRSIAARGPIVLRIGSFVLVAFPSGERRPDALPPIRCTRAEKTSHRAGARNVGIAPLVPAPLAPARLISDVFILPSPVSISEISESGRRPTTGYELAIESNHELVSLRLAPEDLDHGVFVGRDPNRCVGGGLVRILGPRVSRVHVLVLRERDEIVAYDVASLNGTYVDRTRVRAAVLHDGGTELVLGTVPPVRLLWRALALA